VFPPWYFWIAVLALVISVVSLVSAQVGRGRIGVTDELRCAPVGRPTPPTTVGRVGVEDTLRAGPLLEPRAGAAHVGTGQVDVQDAKKAKDRP